MAKHTWGLRLLSGCCVSAVWLDEFSAVLLTSTTTGRGPTRRLSLHSSQRRAITRQRQLHRAWQLEVRQDPAVAIRTSVASQVTPMSVPQRVPTSPPSGLPVSRLATLHARTGPGGCWWPWLYMSLVIQPWLLPLLRLCFQGLAGRGEWRQYEETSVTALI